MSTTALVRRATVEDAATLAEVGARLFAQAFAARNTADNLGAYLASAFSEPQQRRALSDPANVVWLAESDALVVGYAHVKLGSPADDVALQRPVELSRIYADRQWHGTGLGLQLLTVCLDEAAAWSASHVWLGVWKENPRAIAFYEKNGFRIVGEHTFQVGTDPQHDWIMVRELAQR